MSEENKAVVRHLVEEVWNQGNLDVVDEMLTPDFVFHDPSFPAFSTRQDYKQHVSESLAAYPDLHIAIEDTIAEADKVVIRFTASGTHEQWRTGGPEGASGTGKRVTFTGIVISRLADARITEMWVNQDTLGNLQQLGVIPPLSES